MTTYRQNQIAWASIIVVGLSVGLLALYVSTWFLIPFFAMVFVIPRVLKGIDCPKCRTPVTYQGTFFGKQIFGGFINKKRQQCDWDLNTVYPPSN